MDDEQSKQSKGGKARAEKLSKSERKEIAQRAAGARWKLPEATHEGVLTIGDMTLETAVLEDGTRVITQGKLMEAMGMYYSGYLSTNRPDQEDGAAEMPYYLAHKSLQPFVQRHLGAELQGQPLKFRTKRGAIANAIKAETLPRICEIWLDARNAGALKPRMRLIAEKAEILIRGFAHVGIVALIDEVTGYQYDRQRDELQELLKAILSDELHKWAKTFPATYFREMCRLRGTPYRADMRLPSYFGHLTNDVVYKRLAPGVLDELRKRNPADGAGKRRAKHFQWLSKDVGHPMLLQHLGLVNGLMKISKTWDEFKDHLDKAAPIQKDLPLFRSLQDDQQIKRPAERPADDN